MLDRFTGYLRSLGPQHYVNAVITLIGLTADIIALTTFIFALNTPTSGSNFYVNNREFLAWVMLAIIYSVGFANAIFRRRWRGIYGTKRADHSALNLFAGWGDLAEDAVYEKRRNFKRDFSVLYVVMFPITFFYSRAVAATANATGITSSPWLDVLLSAVFSFPVAWAMMIVTSMFDFAMSIFAGDHDPDEHITSKPTYRIR